MADWLEIRALLAADQNASLSDLRRALVQAGVLSEAGESNMALDDEVLARDAFSELEERAASAADAYPFVIENSLVRCKADLASFWAYIFCLLLSVRGVNGLNPGRRPTEIFEEVAEAAARRYLNGRSVKFGFPRRVLPAGFIEALELLCKEIGEGLGGRQRPSSRKSKDARLDLVAWRPFPDSRSAQVILFGQCAAGSNWQNKLTDLQSDAFIDIYLKEAPAVRPLRAFFTPFRISFDRWYEHAKLGGIIFDRCRIAVFAHSEPPPQDLIRWNSRQLRAANET